MALDLLNQFWKRTEQEANFRPFAADIRKARPFSLDAELSGIVSRLAFEKVTLKSLRHYIASARLPYPVMWIEADYDSAFEFKPEPEAYTFARPERVGWILREVPGLEGGFGIVRVCLAEDSEAPGVRRAGVWPIMHLFTPAAGMSYDNAFTGSKGLPTPVAEVLNRINLDPQVRLLPWRYESGMAAHQAKHRRGNPIWENEAEAMLDVLGKVNAVTIEPSYLERIMEDQGTDFDRAQTLDDMVYLGLNDQGGELAFLVTALAILNEVPCRYVPWRPAGSIRAGGRMRPFMTNSIVTIEVPATRRRIREIDKHLKQRGEAASRARHEVRGHYRHVYKLPSGNPERWERTVDRQGRPCWRTWIEHHERGDASLGWVKQTYAAVANRTTSRELLPA